MPRAYVWTNLHSWRRQENAVKAKDDFRWAINFVAVHWPHSSKQECISLLA